MWGFRLTGWRIDYALRQKIQAWSVVPIRVFVHDLTQLKTAEEQLRAFVEPAPDAMIVVSAREEIIVETQRAELPFGYTRKGLLGRELEMLAPAERRAATA